MAKQTQSEQQPRSGGALGRRTRTLWLVAVVSLVLATIGSDAASGLQHGEHSPMFGCPVGKPLVIANVDCNMGVVDAFAPPTDPGTPGRAPWCGEVADLTIYGCATDRDLNETDVSHGADWPWSADTAPAHHPDGASRLAELQQAA